MESIEKYIQKYISELSVLLSSLSRVQRENYIEEIRDHLNHFIKDQQTEGHSEKMILNKIKKEFESPEQLATQILSENQSTDADFIVKSRFVIIGFSLIFLALPMFSPNLGTIPLAMLVLIYSYFVFTKKYLWGLFIFKKNPRQIKNTTKMARFSGIYLFCVGVIILLDNIYNLTNVLIILIVGFLGFSLIFTRKNINYK